MARRKRPRPPAPTPTPSGFKRSFAATSWWNTPIPADLKVDPNSAKMIGAQKPLCGPPTIGSPGGAWAMPWSECLPGQGELATVVNKSGTTVKLYIDPKVGAMTGDDAAIIWRDWNTGVELSTFETVVERKADGTVDVSKPIRCTGYSIFALGSSGIARQAGGEATNTGHRGIPASPSALHPLDTDIRHRLKTSLGPPGDKRLDGKPMPIWPMYGNESPRAGGVPEGAVLRLKGSSVNQANPVQVAMNLYGCIVGDTAGPGKAAIKTVQGGTYPATILKALDTFTWEDWEVVTLGWK